MARHFGTLHFSPTERVKEDRPIHPVRSIFHPHCLTRLLPRGRAASRHKLGELPICDTGVFVRKSRRFMRQLDGTMAPNHLLGSRKEIASIRPCQSLNQAHRRQARRRNPRLHSAHHPRTPALRDGTVRLCRQWPSAGTVRGRSLGYLLPGESAGRIRRRTGGNLRAGKPRTH